MKRLPFNTITILWGVVIFLASCAFTTKTQQAQSEQSNSTLQPPSKDFIQQLKLRNSCMDESSYPTHCYDFTEVDFENYNKPTFENLFTTYADLFDLGKYDEMRFKYAVKYRKGRRTEIYKNNFSELDLYQYHKGIPVYSRFGLLPKTRIYGDSLAINIWKVSSTISSNLNVDTLCTYPTKEALIKAQDVAPMKDGEFFTWEKWKYKEGSGQEQLKSWFFPPVPQKVIYQDKIAYRFELPKKTVDAAYVVVEVFIDAQNGEVLFIKNPSGNNLTTPTKTNYYLDKLLVESEVEYTVENPTISGANNEFLEFDINVASMMNNEDFYSGEILIDYNSLTFGTNLASSGRITLIKGTVITAPNYTLSIVDVSPDQMKITAQSSPSNPSSYYTITNQSEELVHIKIDISNLAGNTGIEFDEVQMQGLSELFDASLSSNKPFDLVTAADELNIDINGILNVMNTCTTCPNGVGNWLQNQNPCPVANCACNDNVFSDVVDAAPTHYYQCKNIGFKDCDNDDLIKL